MNKTRKWALWGRQALLGVALGLLGLQASAADFLPEEQAFALSAQVRDARTVTLRFAVAPGYHLYRERMAVEGEPAAVLAQPAQWPAGKVVHDDNFDKDVEVYEDAVSVDLALAPGNAPFKLVVAHQGCADKGLCYPPQTQTLRVLTNASGVASVALVNPDDAAPAATATAASPAPAATEVAAAPAKDDASRIEGALKSGSLLTISGVFLLAGLLLSFTPCVLPMVPILSSIIVGQGGEMSRAKGFGLSLSYALGMALVYTSFGVVAGLLGEGLAAALQNPWVLGSFALLLVALSLSMFGVYQLQMPGFVQSRLTEASSRVQGGKHVGVFVMGGLSALIVGPCVAAPLAGALVYISQTRDVLIGGVALFALAMGMSVPLLLVGLSAGSLLPRAGAWMERVKSLFGVLLLAVAIWMVAPVIPDWAGMALWGALCIGCAVFMRVLDPLPADVGAAPRLIKGVGAMLAVVGLAQWVGAMSGGNDVLQPLKHLAGGQGTAVAAAGGAAPAAANDKLAFRRVRTLQELDAEVAAAGKPVMLDFYADWCVSCKEYERFTFSDPGVRAQLAGVQMLQVDVTANTAEDKALMKRFGLFGPPGIVFFDAQGKEQQRVIGYMDAPSFLQRLNALGS